MASVVSSWLQKDSVIANCMSLGEMLKLPAPTSILLMSLITLPGG
jgi:hypothetical protein